MSFFMNIVLIDLIGLLIAAIVMVYAFYKWTFLYWKRRNVPYLEPSIPFGNLENPLRATINVGELIARHYSEAKSHGWRHCGIFLMINPTYLVIDLELVKHIMTKDFSNFTDRGSYSNEKDDPLTNHLVALGGSKWRNLRTKLTPTFSSGKLKAMFQTLVDCGVILENYIEENTKINEPFDIKDLLGKFSTDVIGSCAFGLECNSFKDPNSPFRVYGKKVFTSTTLSNFKLQFCRNFPNVARALHLKVLSKDVSDFFIKVVEDTVAYRVKNNVCRKDFLQLLIDLMSKKEEQENGQKGNGQSMTILEAAAQSFVFFIAGFETSSTTMTFALFELAIHLEIQDKVREEINIVLKKHNDEITYESMAELKYMTQVIDETLRIHTTVPFVGRVCMEDYKVPGENVIIEKGTNVMIPILGIHKDPEYYKNPEVFDPEHFSDENKKTRNQYAHMPFGEGPRMCIGERFGMMQIKVGLTSLLKNFRITLNKKTELPIKLSKKSTLANVDNGIWLNIEKL